VRPPSVSLGAAPDWPADAIPVADQAKVAAVAALLRSLPAADGA